MDQDCQEDASAGMQALTKSNQQSVDKMTQYKERYRGLKAAMNDKEKQLDLAKRTIERLSGQCNAMEVRYNLFHSRPVPNA